MPIKLYYTPETRAIRVRWLLEELQLPYDVHSIDLFAGEGNRPEYRAVHPLGSVPAVEIDGQVMIESGAICHWLADQYPEKALAPNIGDPLRMSYEQWMFFVPGTLEPPAFDMALHSKLLPETKRITAVVPWAMKRYIAVLKVLEAALANKTYLLGEQFSSADIMLGSTLLWFPELLRKYPYLQAYTQRLCARDAYLRASAD